METVKHIVPCKPNGEPIEGQVARDYIFFTVNFNNYRDTGVSTANEVLDREVIESTECVLLLPDTYTESGKKTPLIIFAHGAGSRVCEEKNIVGGVTKITNCVDAGYAVLDICGTVKSGHSFGCPEYVHALHAAYLYAVENYNLSSRVLVGGASMGGLSSMNFANTFPGIVRAAGLFYPRLNLNTVMIDGISYIGARDREKLIGKKPQREHIGELYRFDDPYIWQEERAAGFNTYCAHSFTDDNGMRYVIPPCPVKIWHGTADKTVDCHISIEYISAIRRAGGYAELHLLDGVGHSSNSVMQEEILMWFNRFR